MAQKSGFFNSVNHDRTYDASDVARFLKKFFTNGIFNNSLQVTANNNMTVSVATGQANIEGYGYENDSSLTLDITDADSELSRIDSVILRLDLSNRQITVQILEGNSSSSPSQPTIIRTGNIYDLRLANILVSAGATRIITENITDTRFGADCGNVVGAVQQIDTSNVFAQYEAMFNAWFNELQVELDGDVAANLENQIINLENEVGDLSDLDTSNKTDLVSAINEAVEKNVITAMLNQSSSIQVATTWGINKITLEDEYTNIGEKLTLSQGSIKIGNGVHHVKVSANVFIQGISGDLIGGIMKNSDRVSIGYSRTNSTGQFITITFAPIVLEVLEDDEITLNVGASTTGTLTVSAGGTYLTVEVID